MSKEELNSNHWSRYLSKEALVELGLDHLQIDEEEESVEVFQTSAFPSLKEGSKNAQDQPEMELKNDDRSEMLQTSTHHTKTSTRGIVKQKKMNLDIESDTKRSTFPYNLNFDMKDSSVKMKYTEAIKEISTENYSEPKQLNSGRDLHPKKTNYS